MLYHDPFSLTYIEPVGAVPESTRVTFRLLAKDADGICSLYLKNTSGGAETLTMARSGEYWSVSAELSGTGLAGYGFISTSGVCLGPGGKTPGHTPETLWPITVYRGDFTAPEWFRDGVCYQIFPDRFCRSASAPAEEARRYHEGMGRRVTLHGSFSEEPEYLPAPGAKDYLPEDYFGGDLRGIAEKLPYLASLGVTCLYLNPIFEADSNHRYNTADYLKIDPFLGTEADLQELCARAGGLGIRILLDGVFSHTGADSVYFNIRGTYPGGAYVSRESPYYPWFRFREWPEQYECWWGFKALPEVEELNADYQRFILGAGGVIDTWGQCGVSGWRLDVADELPDAFIRSLRSTLKKRDPESVLLGEVWEDCSDKEGPEGRRRYVDGEELDGAMNYPFRKAVLEFLSGRNGAYALEESLWKLYTHYPRPFYESCLNLLSSHDEVRALTYLSGAPDRYSAPREEQAHFSPCKEAAERGRRLFCAAMALQAVMPGVPCVYYGDEAGLTGMADPFNRRPYPWGNEDKALLELERKLLWLRRQDRALNKEAAFRCGALHDEVFAVIRHSGEAVTVLLVNRSAAEQKTVLFPALLCRGNDGNAPLPFAGRYADAITGEILCAQGTLSCSVPAEGFVLLQKIV